MATFRKQLTTEELQNIAAEKLEEAAAALPPGPDRQKAVRHAAEVKGWLASELRPPKLTAKKTNLEYRAYSVGDDGHIAQSNQFVAPNDDTAFEHARQFVDGHDVELWSGQRLVARLKRVD